MDFKIGEFISGTLQGRACQAVILDKDEDDQGFLILSLLDHQCAEVPKAELIGGAVPRSRMHVGLRCFDPRNQNRSSPAIFPHSKPPWLFIKRSTSGMAIITSSSLPRANMKSGCSKKQSIPRAHAVTRRRQGV